jgi:hypothetical protein
LAAALAILLPVPPAAGADEAKISHCHAIYNEVWELRAKGKETPGNQLHGRARAEGCLESPIAETLCPILNEQELLREAEGKSGLASVIRAQKRRFSCA